MASTNHSRRAALTMAGAGALSLAALPALANPAGEHDGPGFHGDDLIDLSHALEQGVKTYPGFPTPVITKYIDYEESKAFIADGRVFAIDRLDFIGGSSTYVDSPAHFYDGGGDITTLPIRRLFQQPAVLVPAPPRGRREYRPSDFAGLKLRGKAVLLVTGWDKKWKTDAYQTGSPYLGPEAADFLAKQNPAFVGIDAVLVDDIDDPNPKPLREAHHALLGRAIPIVENMANLTSLPHRGARITAIPAAVVGVGSFPVRAFATH